MCDKNDLYFFINRTILVFVQLNKIFSRNYIIVNIQIKLMIFILSKYKKRRSNQEEGRFPHSVVRADHRNNHGIFPHSLSFSTKMYKPVLEGVAFHLHLFVPQVN